MTLDQAISIACARHGNPRYRELCAEDYPDRESRDAYRALVYRIAGEPEPARPAPPAWPSAEELARNVAGLKIVRRCPWRAAPRCGCSPARCALAGGRPVTDRQCLDCVARYGDA